MGTYLFYGNVVVSRLIVSTLYETTQASQRGRLQQPELTRSQYASLSPSGYWVTDDLAAGDYPQIRQ